MSIICSSLLRRFTFSFLLVCSFFNSSFTYALDYYWSDGSGHNSISPNSVCSSAASDGGLSELAAIQPGYFLYPDTYVCRYNMPGYSEVLTDWISVFRYGDSCPATFEYNAETGECDPPVSDPCESEAGAITYSQHYAGTLGPGGVVNGYVDPPISICSKDSRCQYSFTYDEPKLVYFPGGEVKGVFTRGKYLGNGTSCTPGTTDPDAVVPSPDGEEIQKDKSATCSEIVTGPTGVQTYSCNSSDAYVEPGTVNCSFVDGKAVSCQSGNPKPKSVKTDTSTDVTITTNPDGSKTKITETTTTKTICSGVDSCKTETTTNISNSGTNADGSPGSESSSCKGPGCTGNKTTEEEVEKLKDQDKKEEAEKCDPATDPDQCGQSSVSGDSSCDAEPVCKGDAVQCSILRQTHKARCDAELAGDYEGHADDIGALVSGPQFEKPEDSTIDLAGIFNTGTRFLPSVCPADTPLNLASLGRTFNFSWAPLCSLAEYAGFLFVALASLFFVRYVGEGQS